MDAGSAITVVDRLIGCCYEPIKQELGYFNNYKKNLENLEKNLEELQEIRSRLQQAKDATRANLHVVAPHIETWLINVDKTTAEAESIFRSKAQVERGSLIGLCPNLRPRYKLSKQSEKLNQEVIKNLAAEGKGYLSFSYPAPVTMLEYVMPTRSSDEFESRKQKEEEITNALMDGRINIIGVCGMGGVGKTTLVKKIGKKMKEGNFFDEVVMATVSQKSDMKTIQCEVAEGLGLELKEESIMIRASKLHRRLLDARKPLIILDDVWERLDLVELGILAGSMTDCCSTILITSRSRDVCTYMESQKVIQMEVLPEEEAWLLFTEKTSISEECDLHDIAKEVANECKGLPIALVTVGRALRGKRKPLWEDALLQLRRSIPTNIPRMFADVYRPLELSYNHLESDEARYLFQLCCLFKEDTNIRVEELVKYGIGLDMFVAVQSLREARNRVHGLVDTLKNCFLLLDGSKEHVKMHDVIRDVAIFTASRDKHVAFLIHDENSKGWSRETSCDEYQHIAISTSESDTIKLLMGLRFPKLDLLMLEGSTGVEIPDNFFKGMTKLKVLSMKGNFSLSLPTSLGLLTNLRTLHLSNLQAENISILGELANLEILSIMNSSIKMFPLEIGRLTKLRLLDLTYCTRLNLITPGVISRLVALEELYMHNSFKAWEIKKEGNQSTAALTELEALVNLNRMELNIEDPKVLYYGGRISSKLTKYQVLCGDSCWKRIVKLDYDRYLYLNLPEMHPLGEWISSLLHNAEIIVVLGDGSKAAIDVLVPDGFQLVKELNVSSSDSIEYLANTTKDGIFPSLQSLELDALYNLKVICHGELPAGSLSKISEISLHRLHTLTHLWSGSNTKVSFAYLKTIDIRRCYKLRNIFSFSVARSLLQLEKLKIDRSRMMEELFQSGSETDEDSTSTKMIKFPMLNVIELVKLESLISLGKEIKSIECPQLTEMTISRLQKLKTLCPTNSNHGTYLNHFFNGKVACPKLRILRLDGLDSVDGICCHQLPSSYFSQLEQLKISHCHNFRKLFTPSLARGIINLKNLIVKSCSRMEEVVAEEESAEQGGRASDNKLSLFPKLESLTLLNLGQLGRFCNMKHALEWLSLTSVYIDGCPQLQTFSLGSIDTQNLSKFRIDKKQMEMKDLNRALQHYFQSSEQKVFSEAMH